MDHYFHIKSRKENGPDYCCFQTEGEGAENTYNEINRLLKESGVFSSFVSDEVRPSQSTKVSAGNAVKTDRFNSDFPWYLVNENNDGAEPEDKEVEEVWDSIPNRDSLIYVLENGRDTRQTKLHKYTKARDNGRHIGIRRPHGVTDSLVLYEINQGVTDNAKIAEQVGISIGYLNIVLCGLNARGLVEGRGKKKKLNEGGVKELNALELQYGALERYLVEEPKKTTSPRPEAIIAGKSRIDELPAPLPEIVSEKKPESKKPQNKIKSSAERIPDAERPPDVLSGTPDEKIPQKEKLLLLYSGKEPNKIKFHSTGKRKASVEAFLEDEEHPESEVPEFNYTIEGGRIKLAHKGVSLYVLEIYRSWKPKAESGRGLETKISPQLIFLEIVKHAGTTKGNIEKYIRENYPEGGTFLDELYKKNLVEESGGILRLTDSSKELLDDIENALYGGNVRDFDLPEEINLSGKERYTERNIAGTLMLVPAQYRIGICIRRSKEIASGKGNLKTVYTYNMRGITRRENQSDDKGEMPEVPSGTAEFEQKTPEIIQKKLEPKQESLEKNKSSEAGLDQKKRIQPHASDTYGHLQTVGGKLFAKFETGGQRTFSVNGETLSGFGKRDYETLQEIKNGVLPDDEDSVMALMQLGWIRGDNGNTELTTEGEASLKILGAVANKSNAIVEEQYNE